MIIKVKVNTSSRKTEIVKLDDYYIIKFSAIREKGKANLQLIGILSEYFNTRKTNIRILGGHTSTLKLIEVLI